MRQFVFFFCAFWLLASCNDEESTLNVPIALMEFSNAGGEQTFIIDSNDDWSIYGIPTWLSTSKQSGINTQEVTLKAEENATGLDREQIMMIRTNDSKNIHTVNVLQYAYPEGRVFTVEDCSTRFFNGSNSLEYENSIALKSSAKWNINGPDWLAMQYKGTNSNMLGDLFEGSGTVKLRCRSDNGSEEARKDTIFIQKEKSDSVFKIPVVQLGTNDVMCVDKFIISDGLWTSFKYGDNTEYIQCGAVEGIVSAEQVAGQQWSYVEKNSVKLISGLKPDTDYTICTRKKSSKETVAKKINVEVIHTASEINQPRAMIENVSQRDDGRWRFSTTMNQYAKGYYITIFGSNNREKTYYAFRFKTLIGVNEFAKVNDISFYENSTNWTTSNANKTILTWAVGEDGKLSNVVDAYKIYASSSSTSNQARQNERVEYIGSIDVDGFDNEIPATFELEEPEKLEK